MSHGYRPGVVTAFCHGFCSPTAAQGRRFRSALGRRARLSFEVSAIDRLATVSPAKAATNPATDDTRPATAPMTSVTPESSGITGCGGGVSGSSHAVPVHDGVGDAECVDDGSGDGRGGRSTLRKTSHSVTIPTASSTKPPASRLNPAQRPPHPPSVVLQSQQVQGSNPCVSTSGQIYRPGQDLLRPARSGRSAGAIDRPSASRRGAVRTSPRNGNSAML